MKINEFSSPAELDQALAKTIATRLSASIAKKGQASLVVSGGSTPLNLFKLLSLQPLAWEHVFVTLADERWVDNQHDASNEKLVRANLLQNHAAKAQFVPLKNDYATAEAGAPLKRQDILAMPHPFDVVILGMGDDGHTASLFPNATNLTKGLDMANKETVISMMPTAAPFERITLTLPALLDSQAIFIHIVGENKKAVLQEALADHDVNHMPIRAFLAQHSVPVEVFWATN